ncbi:hypothetical protein LJR251_000305 [Rhizobium rhizogenes]|uniref:hypothetical protein n=1 Tax=Rhizobium rhizogenes TaxID=359 RepID=UPI003ECD801C
MRLLPAAEIQILNQLFIDHFAWEIDMLSEAITLIDHQLDYLDGDEEYEAFPASNAYKRLVKLFRD